MLVRMNSQLCPLDGRYSEFVTDITNICSERGLVRNRLHVEIVYLTAFVTHLSDFSNGIQSNLMVPNIEIDDDLINSVFAWEKITCHDVKAVEMALIDRLQTAGAHSVIPYIHFGLTSQDITSVAVWSQIEACREIIGNDIESIVTKLQGLAKDNMNIPMLARTHGQPATPTTLGKELMVFVERLDRQRLELLTCPISTKFGGATGGFNAHRAAYPNFDWPKWADDFLRDEFEFERQQYTTQIDHYDGMAQVFDTIKRCNTILIDLCRDMWQYISMNYFKLALKKGAIGSSTMPHKVNPIQFENSEGNLLLANSLFEFMSSKLPVSRLQRDLTDSTVLRNIGLAFGYSTVAYRKILVGLNSLSVNASVITNELEKHTEVITEGIQTILRSQGIANAYDLVKEEIARQNGSLTSDGLQEFYHKLLPQLSFDAYSSLLQLTPLTYLGTYPQTSI